MGIGFLVVLLMSWMQTRTPREMLGRMMALLMLASTGLVPIAQAVSGAISKWNLTMLFAIPGVLVLLLTILDGIPPGPERFQREPHSRAGGRVISEKDWEFFA